MKITKAEKEKQAIERIMSGLKCSEEEAKEIYAYDCKVETQAKAEYDLSPEKAKIAQKYAHAGTRKTPTVYQFNNRERKPNATKGGIIAELVEYLEKHSDFSIENLQVPNKERQIAFKIGEDNFELTLIQKRKPK